jgi:UDP-N-acetylmuramoyl-L-alanyl-D-glutamate--2,6-diaminopimelate ligase
MSIEDFIKINELNKYNLCDFHLFFQENDIFIAKQPKNMNLEEYENKIFSYVKRKNPSAIIFIDKIFLSLKAPTLTYVVSEEDLRNYVNNKYNKQPFYTIGITGSSGKSSTCFFLYQMLRALNKKVFLSCSLGIGEDSLEENILTTPSHIILKQMLYKAVSCDFAIVEVSSHAIEQNRLDNINFDYGIYTMFNPDHLDFHKTIENYAATKYNFINNRIRKTKVIDVNLDILDAIKVPSNKYFYQNEGFFIHKNEIKFSNKNLHKYHKDNILKALSLLNEMNLNIINLNNTSLQLPAGRINYIGEYNGGDIYCDGAHSPFQVKLILESLFQKYKKIICVYGMAFHRILNDQETGSFMGKYGMGIVTDDNPAGTNAKEIRQKLLKEDSSLIEIENRFEAIKFGIQNLSSESCLLILGKSSETSNTIEYKDHTLYYNEVSIIGEILNEIKNN